MKRNDYKEYQVEKRVDFLVKNRVNYMSCTISPAPKSVDRKEIESLEEAIRFYKPYTKNVLLSQKFMGSFCQIVLHKNIEDTKFFSRNGYEINFLDREVLLKAVEDLHKLLFIKPEYDIIIVEAELMPWSAMGKGLIEREYTNYGILHNSHKEHLMESGLQDKMVEVSRTPEFQAFKTSYDIDSNGAKKKFKPHIYRQYKEIVECKLPPLVDYEDSIKLFERQLEVFGGEGELHFKPFNILKWIRNDGTEMYNTTNAVYDLFGEQLMVDTQNPDLDAAYAFLEKHRTMEHEGIMVKPLKTRLINIPHCLKVRTNEYLQLIYGVNFNSNFDYYFEKRNVRRKLQASTKGYELSMQLLHIPYHKLTKDNDHYRRLLYKVIGEETLLKELDNRL